MNEADERERKKRAIFDAMSPRRQRRILEKGYEAWDPFLAPKEPSRFYGRRLAGAGIVPREDPRVLFEAFMAAEAAAASRDEYVAGAREICYGLCRGEARYEGMYAFCRWISARVETRQRE
jgi:hypothetical protein